MNPASRLNVRHYRGRSEVHAHDHFQVMWMLTGEGVMEVESQRMAMSPGEGLILWPGERHTFDAPGSADCLVLDTYDSAWRKKPTRATHPDVVNQLAQFLGSALQAGVPVAAQMGPLLLAQSWGLKTPASPKARRDVDWEDLTAWLGARLRQPLTAADLADKACLSESQFRARCVEAMSCSPMEWLRRLRLARAQTLMISGHSLHAAAHETGYSSASALSAALRRTQASPDTRAIN